MPMKFTFDYSKKNWYIAK